MSDPAPREMPSSLECEMQMLGSILLLPEVIDDVASITQPHDCYDPANAKIYTALLSMRAEGKRIDSTLLVETLRTARTFEAVGGMAYLGQVADSVVNAAHAKYYAGIVRDKATLRATIDLLTRTIADAYDSKDEPSAIIERSQGLLRKVEERAKRVDRVSAKEAAGMVLDALDASSRSGRGTGIDTGIGDIDKLTGGLHAGALIILAGRPGDGKSSLADQISDHFAENGHTVLFSTQEMPAEEVAMRNMASHARVNSVDIRSGSTSPDENVRLGEAANRLGSLPIEYLDSPRCSIRELRAAARDMTREGKPPALLIVDYLGLLQPIDARAPRHEQVGLLAKELKLLARELKIPVLCLAQLNRESETRNGRPRLSNLRESGDVEAHADMVLLLYREGGGKNPEAEAKDTTTLIVAKNRNGPCGDIELFFDAERTRFGSIERRFVEFDAYNAIPFDGSDYRERQWAP